MRGSNEAGATRSEVSVAQYSADMSILVPMLLSGLLVGGDLDGATRLTITETIDTHGPWRLVMHTPGWQFPGEDPVKDRFPTVELLHTDTIVKTWHEYSLEASFKHLGGPHTLQVEVTGFSGGAHCCDSFELLALEPGLPRVVLSIPAKEFSGGLDTGPDGTPVYVDGDDTFAYWPGSFAGSPFQSVVLRLDFTGEHPSGILAPDLTWQPAPQPWRFMRTSMKAKAALQKMHDDAVAARGPAARFGSPPREVYGPMVEWCYAGHPHLAWALLRDCWPDDIPGRDAFGDNLQERLDKSIYYPHLPWATVRWRETQVSDAVSSTAPSH